MAWVGEASSGSAAASLPASSAGARSQRKEKEMMQHGGADGIAVTLSDVFRSSGQHSGSGAATVLEKGWKREEEKNKYGVHSSDDLLPTPAASAQAALGMIEARPAPRAAGMPVQRDAWPAEALFAGGETPPKEKEEDHADGHLKTVTGGAGPTAAPASLSTVKYGWETAFVAAMANMQHATLEPLRHSAPELSTVSTSAASSVSGSLASATGPSSPGSVSTSVLLGTSTARETTLKAGETGVATGRVVSVRTGRGAGPRVPPSSVHADVYLPTQSAQRQERLHVQRMRKDTALGPSMASRRARYQSLSTETRLHLHLVLLRLGYLREKAFWCRVRVAWLRWLEACVVRSSAQWLRTHRAAAAMYMVLCQWATRMNKTHAPKRRAFEQFRKAVATVRVVLVRDRRYGGAASSSTPMSATATLGGVDHRTTPRRGRRPAPLFAGSAHEAAIASMLTPARAPPTQHTPATGEHSCRDVGVRSSQTPPRLHSPPSAGSRSNGSHRRRTDRRSRERIARGTPQSDRVALSAPRSWQDTLRRTGTTFGGAATVSPGTRRGRRAKRAHTPSPLGRRFEHDQGAANGAENNDIGIDIDIDVDIESSDGKESATEESIPRSGLLYTARKADGALPAESPAMSASTAELRRYDVEVHTHVPSSAALIHRSRGVAGVFLLKWCRLYLMRQVFRRWRRRCARRQRRLNSLLDLADSWRYQRCKRAFCHWMWALVAESELHATEARTFAQDTISHLAQAVAEHDDAHSQAGTVGRRYAQEYARERALHSVSIVVRGRVRQSLARAFMLWSSYQPSAARAARVLGRTARARDDCFTLLETFGSGSRVDQILEDAHKHASKDDDDKVEDVGSGAQEREARLLQAGQCLFYRTYHGWVLLRAARAFDAWRTKTVVHSYQLALRKLVRKLKDDQTR